MVLVERGQHGVGAGLPVVGLLLAVAVVAVALLGGSVIFMTPSVSR